jgi:diguanylate cyclase (GGDEF)-like protein
MPHLELIREAIATYSIRLRNDDRPNDDQQGRQRRIGAQASSVSVTVSIGVAERQMDQRTPEEVLKSADQALYSAKGAGRNCVVAHGQNRRGAVRMARAAS